MMIKKFVAGLSAAVLAATMMSVSVSAAKLGDVVHPSEEDSKMNDSYYIAIKRARHVALMPYVAE